MDSQDRPRPAYCGICKRYTSYSLLAGEHLIACERCGVVFKPTTADHLGVADDLRAVLRLKEAKEREKGIEFQSDA